MASKEPLLNCRTKTLLFIGLLLAGYALFDLGALSGINDAISNSDIGEHHLREAKIVLFNIFMLKSLWLFILISAAYFLVYWILKPYRQLIAKTKKFAKQYPQLKPLVKGKQNELGQAEKVVQELITNWEQTQDKPEADK